MKRDISNSANTVKKREFEIPHKLKKETNLFFLDFKINIQRWLR